MIDMIKNLVQCDICTSGFPIFPTEEIIPPPNWYIVYHGQAHTFSEASHFCSLECMLLHYSGQAPVVHMSGGGHAQGQKRGK